MADKLSTDDKPEAQPKSELVKNWLTEIADAMKREKDYRKEAQRCVNIFEAKDKLPYNILFANTETMAPALYNQTPRPVVKRRHKDQNPKAAMVSKILQRTLEFLLDSNAPAYTPFDELQKAAVQEALVPGRGLTRFKYEPTFESVPPTAEALQADPKAKPQDRVTYETVCGEDVSWNRVLFGYAQRWSDTPWIAFEHFMTREDCKVNFGDALGGKMALTAVPEDAGDENSKQPADAKAVKFAHVWEIWDKAKKQVIFITDGDPEPIKEIDDPLKLDGFFPIPRPMSFLRKISSLMPLPLYLQYEEQARELNIVSQRIITITRALKIRGFYDSTLKGLEQLLEKDDNTLLPADNVAAMQQGAGLDRAVWLMPLTDLSAVLQQLYANRQQIKQVIYELTGIADILRGSSSASETLGAQKMKEAWGTMRLKRSQKEVQRYARDSLRMMAELAANNFNEQTFAQMTGITLPTVEQKQQLQMQLQMQAQSQPDQPPAPPPPELQQMMEMPTWEEVMAMLKNDLHRNFAIDIETNSTIDAEATDDKEQVAEFMNAFGQMLNGLIPLVERGILTFEVAKALVLTMMHRFRFGAEIEEQIKSMVAPPKPQGGDPKAAAEAAKMQQEMEFSKQENAMRMQELEANRVVQDAERQAKLQEIRLKSEQTALQHQATMAKLRSSIVIAEAQAKTAQIKQQAAASAPAPAGAD